MCVVLFEKNMKRVILTPKGKLLVMIILNSALPKDVRKLILKQSLLPVIEAHLISRHDLIFSY